MPCDPLILAATTTSMMSSSIPTTVHTVLANPNRCAAMEENETLMSNGTWELVF
jgi:hypothetical protein